MLNIYCLSSYSNPVDDYSHLTRELGIELAQHHTGCRQQRRFCNHVSDLQLCSPEPWGPQIAGQAVGANPHLKHNCSTSFCFTYSNLDSLKGSAVTKKREMLKSIRKVNSTFEVQLQQKMFLLYHLPPRGKRIYVWYYRILTIYIEFIYSSSIILICS